MIDPIQIPLLMKAVDFVFDEGRKILEERRTRRRLQETTPQNEEKEPGAELVAAEPEKAAEVKQDLLASKVDEIVWQNHEQEVQHLVRLLETYSRNYYLAKEQYAKWGDALVPPIIVNNLRESETSMIETIQRLETVLSKVYRKDIPSLQ
jgi:hypothetical protein